MMIIQYVNKYVLYISLFLFCSVYFSLKIEVFTGEMPGLVFEGLRSLVNLFERTGYRLQDTGYRIYNTGYRIQDTGYITQDTG